MSDKRDLLLMEELTLPTDEVRCELRQSFLKKIFLTNVQASLKLWR